VTQALTYVFCLGATKAGTSWLQDQLAAHPQCRLRTIKEYHYFTKSKPSDYEVAIALHARETARLTAKNLTRPPEKSLWAKAHIADLAAFEEVLALKKQDNAAFAELLATGPGTGHVVGDFTPAYALLPEAKLAEVARFAPDTRAIYLIRDPVARLWSHVRMVADRARATDLAEAARGLLHSIIAGQRSAEIDGILARGDYAAILPKLARVFDPSRLLITFYEDMLTAPGYARICAFLELSDQPANFDRKIHPGKPLALNQADRAAAARFLRPQYEYVAKMFPHLPDAWQPAMNEA
jgi:hypothetical protein